LNNRYQVLSLQGKGGFSEIYKVVDLETDCLKILKLHKLREDWSALRKEYYYNQTIKEGKVLKSFNHENIIKFEDFLVIDQNNFATIMEFCPGVDLGVYLQKKKCLPEIETKDIMKQIIFAVNFE
jgi:tousled-like kinase